jgi:quercetin dioxygenase-like cupin family protein
MTIERLSYPWHRFPAEIISHAVWLYHVFSLCLRDVELILAEPRCGVARLGCYDGAEGGEAGAGRNRRNAMQEGARGMRLAIAGYERVMEGADMRASVLTLAAGECVPWHYHSTITDSFVCLEGPMEVETRAPPAVHRLTSGQRCEVAPKTAHTVRGVDGGSCRFLLMQGVGLYDNVAVG